MQLPSVYPFFVIEFSFEFGQKNNFGVSFYAITFAISISSWFNFCEFGMVNAFTSIHENPRSAIAIVQKPSQKRSKPNVRLQITSNRTPLTRNRGGGGVVMTTASNP